MIVTRTGDDLVLGAPPADPAQRAVLEADGAVLVWDAGSTGALPHAIVWDARRAAAWAWEIYGPDAAAALLGDASAFEPAPGPSAAPARTAAVATWAQAWWPASVPAGIPPLDPRLLALERALALLDVEQLLDDPGAVDGALRAASAFDATGLDPDLLVSVRDAAEDRGLDLPLPAPRRVAYALAASTPPPAAAPLATGSAPIDLGAVPTGAVDAGAPAHWSVTRDGAETVLHVYVDRAPRHPADEADAPALHAAFAGAVVALTPDAAAYTGSVAVAASLLLSRDRALVVSSPGFVARGEVDAATLIDVARRRLAQPELAAEREAAR